MKWKAYKLKRYWKLHFLRLKRDWEYLHMTLFLLLLSQLLKSLAKMTPEEIAKSFSKVDISKLHTGVYKQ